MRTLSAIIVGLLVIVGITVIITPVEGNSLQCAGTSVASFWDRSQHCDCDYADNSGYHSESDDQQILDLFWIAEIHKHALEDSPRLPFVAALVDPSTNSMIGIATAADSYLVNSLGASLLLSDPVSYLVNNISNTLYRDATSPAGRVPSSEWSSLTLYANVEPSTAGAAAALTVGLRNVVFGLSASALRGSYAVSTLTLREIYEQAGRSIRHVRGPASPKSVQEDIYRDLIAALSISISVGETATTGLLSASSSTSTAASSSGTTVSSSTTYASVTTSSSSASGSGLVPTTTGFSLVGCVAPAYSYYDASVPRHLQWARLMNERVQEDLASSYYAHTSGPVTWGPYSCDASFQCVTDCSGFVTALWLFSYNISIDQLVGYRALAFTYCDIIQNQRYGFSRIFNVADFYVGDILAIRYLAVDPTDPADVTQNTGHMGIINALPTQVAAVAPVQPGTLQWAVELLDQTSDPHGITDSRYDVNGTGIGTGFLRIYSNATDGTITGYSWKVASTSTYYSQSQRPVYVGRVRLASTN